MPRNERAVSPAAEALKQQLEEKQRNMLWPDTLQNSKGVDEFLWHGSPHPRPVQRIAAVAFGLFFILGAIAVVSMSLQAHASAVGIPIALGFGYAGLRVFRSGWAKK